MADFIQNGGSSGGTYAGYYTGKLSVWENSYDVSSNSSNVGYRLQLISGNSGRFGDLKASYSVNIDGVVRNSGSGSYSLGHNGTITLCEGNFTIWHNDDGRKSVWCSATIDFQNHTYSPGDFYPSGNLDLSTIPRASSIFCTTASVEETSIITIASASNSFRHNVRVDFGSQHINIVENREGGNFSWTIPSSFYNEIPNSKSGTGTVICDTYNNGVFLGSKSSIITVTTNEEKCKPNLSSAVIDVNEITKKITGNNQKLIKHKSTAKVTITSNAKNGSSIVSKKVNNENVGGDSILIYEIDTDTFVATVTDSRGYSNSVTLKPAVINYIPLSINAIIKRTQPTTGEVDITFSGNYYNNKIENINNELLIKWFYREKEENEWITGGTITPVLKENTFSNGEESISLGKKFDYKKIYEFYLEITDKLSALTPQFIVAQGIPIFNWGKDFLNVNGKILANGIDINGTILYDNESGTTGTVTLSESAANFNYLEIYAGRMYWQYCTKIQHPNNTKTNLVTAYSEVNNKTFYTYCKCIQISGTSIITNYSQIQFTPNGGTPSVGADDSYKIFKVVGYRKEA